MKLDIQLFGGRGASSSGTVKGNTITFNSGGKKQSVNYRELNNGDTFEVTEKSGETVTLSIKKYSTDNGYYVEGRASDGGRISYLVTDTMYKKAGKIDRLYMIPLSKTKNWKRK